MKELVGLSGGKDSTATALRLKDLYPKRDYVFFCTPTGDELPEMKTHWKKLESILKQPIVYLTDPKYPTIFKLIEHFKALPNYHQRWCTRILKIEVAQTFYNQFDSAVVHIGLRADEPTRKGHTLYDENIKQNFPLRDWGWGIDEVWDYLNYHKIEIPRRTDCAMCFYQRIGEWWMLWKEHPLYFKRISDLEDELAHTLMTPGKHKVWPHKLSDLSTEFKKGREPREIKSGRKIGCRVCSL